MTDGSRSRSGRGLRLVVLLVVGVVLGAALSLAAQDRRADGDADADAEARPGAGGPGALAPSVAVATGTAAEPTTLGGPPTQQVLLAWTADPLPPMIVGATAAVPGVERATAVRHASIALVASVAASGSATTWPAGSSVPIDAIAVDPADYPAFVPPDLAATFATLGPGEAVLSRTGAELRGVGVGAALGFARGGDDPPAIPVVVHVRAVVDDAVIGGAELAVATETGDALGITEDRYLLVAHHGDRAAIEDQLRAVASEPIRFRGPGETPFLRDGDAVLPQAMVKAAYGEFAVHESRGRLEPDPAWQEDNLVTADVPVLGQVRCHRAVVDDLRAAMSQIERDNLAYLVDPTPSSVACFYLDTIDRTGALSRGTWGVAVALNSVKNPSGSGSVQDPRIVEILQANGFTWGGDFLVPEPGYFEHIGPSGSAGPNGAGVAAGSATDAPG